MNETNKSTYKGFELFNDIQDKILRIRNRAVVMANIAVDNSKNRLISAKGAALILGYFGQIPAEERNETRAKFQATMEERGYRLNAA